MYCATRWIGLHTCCNGAWLALVVLKEQLIADNYSCTDDDNLDDINDEDEDEDEEIVNEYEDTLHQEDNTNSGNVHTSASKTDKLLSVKI